MSAQDQTFRRNLTLIDVEKPRHILRFKTFEPEWQSQFSPSTAKVVPVETTLREKGEGIKID